MNKKETRKYWIKIPHSNLSIGTISSPSGCAVAKHFKTKGYNVLVGVETIYFARADKKEELGLANLHKRGLIPVIEVPILSGYMHKLLLCEKQKKDFKLAIDLPVKLFNAKPGSEYRKEMP